MLDPKKKKWLDMDIAAMDEAVQHHSSCCVGHKIYIVGGTLGDFVADQTRPNDSIFSLDMHSPRQWDEMDLNGLGMRLNPVICQIGPESLVVSGGKSNLDVPLSTFVIDFKSNTVDVLAAYE